MPENLVQVIENDLCIGCGACQPACPYDAIETGYSECHGAYQVAIAEPKSCIGCDAPCEKVCPSIEVDFASLLSAELEQASEPDLHVVNPLSRHGPVREVVLGYAPQYRENGISSSGGLVRQIVRHFLDAGTTVVCLGTKAFDHETARFEGERAPDRPLRYGMMALEKPNEMNHVPGSIYHAIDLTDTVEIVRKQTKPVVLVAIPCQLEGFMKYCREIEPELANKVVFKVGIICGWMYSDHSYKLFSTLNRLPKTFGNVTYRGDGEAGSLKFYYGDKIRAFNRRVWKNAWERIKFSSSYSRDVNRLRCRLCENHTNVGADISVGDAWLERKRGEKTSIAVVRTAKAANLVATMQDSGELDLEPGRLEDIDESQSVNLVQGVQARKLSQYRQAQGQFVPRFLFDDSQTPDAELQPRDIAAFDREMRRRKLLREGKYVRYVASYVHSKVAK